MELVYNLCTKKKLIQFCLVKRFASASYANDTTLNTMCSTSSQIWIGLSPSIVLYNKSNYY